MKHLFPLVVSTTDELEGYEKINSVPVNRFKSIFPRGNKMNFLIALLMYLTGTSSCLKESLHIHNPGAVDLYVAGDITRPEGAISFYPVAAYWKNGYYTALTDGTITADAASIGVIGNDVYVAGTYGNDPSASRAVYWKNGNLSYLTDGVGSSKASSIAISGNDVYIAGAENRGTNYVAKYWKNGNAVNLTDGSGYAGAFSIFVSGNDVYVAGDSGNLAHYWINGIGYPIPPTSQPYICCESYSHANSIYVAGKDVYVAGYENSHAMCWKNGVPFPLGNLAGSSSSTAFSVVVSGKDVYVAGQIEFITNDPIGTAIAFYWKNGVPVNFTDANAFAWSRAIAIAVKEDDIYIGGIGSSMAELWINGVGMQLPGQTNALAGEANSIFIARSSSKPKWGKY